MPGKQLISDEAKQLDAAMHSSPIAFAYFDLSDRLQLWNAAYESLNFRIRHLIRKGAFFPDLLAELVERRQIVVDGDEGAWVDARLRARQLGRTAFRHLTDGRVFLVQERKDELGGTLGFWVNVSDMFQSGARHGTAEPIAGTGAGLSQPGSQDLIRNQLQTIMSTLEMVRRSADSEMRPFVAEALLAADTIRACLDICREEAG